MGAIAMETRSAMAVHHTATTDESWDAGMMVGQMGDAPGEAKLREMHAWVDPAGDPETKAAYRLPHHMCSMDGEVGAANMAACSSGIGSLNGARGGSSIPDGDRQGVYGHLAAHLTDGGQTAPELRNGSEYERRSVDLAELRVEGETGSSHIRGHAAVFSSPTEIYGLFGSFIEEIAPGAFTKTLKEADVRALFNHNPDYVLGRNRAGTLGLTEDSRGLAVDITPPDAQWARDLMVSMARGDITQMSFGFIPVAGKSDWNYTSKAGELDKVVRREVKLIDVSVVSFAAYQQTDAYVRSAIAALERYLPPEPGTMHPHSATNRREPPTPRHSLDQLRSRLAALPDQEASPSSEPARKPSHSLAECRAWLSRVEQFS